MWVVKTFILLLAAIVFLMATSPPRPAKTPQVYQGQRFEYIMRYLSRFNCFLVAAPCVCQCTLLVMNATTPTLHDAALPYLCPSPSSTLTALTLLTPRFALGSLALILGSALRLWCFHELGELFTYEVVVQENHTLITTGPYAFVRHPAYVGSTGAYLGAQIMLFGAGSYMTECGLEKTPVKIFAWAWEISLVYTLLSLYRRCRVEDGLMKKRFGKVWDAYWGKVPYALLPGVY